MSDEVASPFVLACLALDLAGFKVGDLQAETIEGSLEDGFKLEFEINDRLSLGVTHVVEDGTFEIVAAFEEAPSPGVPLDLVLKLNSLMLDGGGGYAMHPETGSLMYKQVCDLSGVSAEDLAEAMLDAVQAIVTLDEQALATRAASDLSALRDINSAIRV